jgi:hopanoid biosynthesis associated RND transporter like protein HpnN
MTSPPPSRLAQILCRITDAAQRHAPLTLTLALVITLALGHFATTRITFNSDPNTLFSSELRFQRAIAEFEQYFPVLTNSLLIVINADTPEQVRRAAEQLTPALDAQKQDFLRAYLPGEDRFFERHGLLYGSVDDVYDFADHMAVVQPVLAELAQDPTLPTLTSVLQTGLDAVADGSVSDEGWEAVLEHIRTAAMAIDSGDDSALSWESVLISGTGFEPVTRTVIVAEPILDFERVFAAERSIAAARETIERLGLVPENGIEVLITGYPAINYEEMMGLATDTTLAGALSFVFVIVMLSLAFRSWRMVVAAAITLVAGIVWAVAFSAATVQELNPISITFGILVIGLGIDFMIHLGMHVAEEAGGGANIEEAIHRATLSTGVPLTLCALTTGVGFLAFVPTDFRGVSDLGMAAAGGMVSILILTFTLFPALARLLLVPEALARFAARGRHAGLRILTPRSPAYVVGIGCALTFAALWLLPSVDLETNVISLRNQSTESVRGFKELLEERATTPWFLDALAPSLDEAVVLAEQMRNLPTVEMVATLADFVPTEQDEKIEILADVSLMLGLPQASQRQPVAPERQRAALEALRDYSATAPLGDDHPLSPHISDLHTALVDLLAPTGTAHSSELSDVLLDPIPDQIARLQANLAVGSISRADLPPEFVERMLSADGHARIQAYPAEDLWDHAAMVDFVESIREVWPEITGLPVNLVESARVTWQSLRAALLWASLAIAVLLIALWRNARETIIVMLPLLLAVLLTTVSTVVLPITLNFGSVIVLPLLLGIGVDSGIHLVERFREVDGQADALLDSTTARAVLFSGFTTVASFGTLIISLNLGVASLGKLLVVGMAWTLLANLILLPAILSIFLKGKAPAASKSA